ncbi:N-acetyl-alpha-D-glucosaminyl L-malate synthase BshA [Peptococcaceae bacterium 1198_IL3148]
MKIGMLCYWNYGGSAVVAAELGKQLADRGHQVHFISAERPFRLDEYHPNTFVHQTGDFSYPVFSSPPFFLLQVNKILEVVKDHQLDLLHAHYAIPHCLSAIFARHIMGNNIPIITTLHGTDITLVGQNKEFYQITKYGLEHSDMLTAVSKWLALETQRVFKLKDPPSVIYNFLDSNYFNRRSDEGLRRSYAADHEKIVIHISNFRSVKNVPDVINIFHLINESLPSQLILVGDGPDMTMVREKVTELNLNSRVHFLGQQQDVVPLLSVSDLLLLPSRRESFGLVALEALACGVPVVASNVGGLPEVVANGITGLLADCGDPRAMAQLSIKILSDDSLWQKISWAARQSAENFFNADRWVNHYEEIYYSLLAGKK